MTSFNPEEAKNLIEKLAQDLARAQTSYPNYEELAILMHQIRGKIYDPANAALVDDLIHQAQEALAKKIPPPPLSLTYTPLPSLEDPSLEALQNLKQKISPLPSQINPLEINIKNLIEEVKSCEEVLQQLKNSKNKTPQQLYETLSQQLLEIQENFDFLKDEYSQFETQKKNLFDNLSHYVNDMQRTKKDHLNSPPTEREDPPLKLKALETTFHAQLLSCENSLTQSKSTFERNQTALHQTLLTCMQNLKHLQTLLSTERGYTSASSDSLPEPSL